MTEGCYQELLRAVAKGSGAGNSKGGAEPSAKDCGDPRARQAGGEGAQQGRKARQSINYINYINSRLEMTWARSLGWEETRPQDGNAEQKWAGKGEIQASREQEPSPGCSPMVQRWEFTARSHTSTRDISASDSEYRMELQP